VDLPPDFWVAAGVIVAAIGTIGTGIKWLTSRNQEKERDRIAREAHEITKKAFEANAIPQVTVDTYSAAYFRGYGTIPAGDYHALRPPDPYVVPIPMLIATVKNEGKVPVQIEGRNQTRTHRCDNGSRSPGRRRKQAANVVSSATSHPRVDRHQARGAHDHANAEGVEG